MTKFLEKNSVGLLFNEIHCCERVLVYGDKYNEKKYTLEVFDINEPIYTTSSSIVNIAKDMKDVFYYAKVLEGEIGLHFIDGKFIEFLEVGEYVYFSNDNTSHKHLVKTYSTKNVIIGNDVPLSALSTTFSDFYTSFIVNVGYQGILYIDNKFVEVLEPGTYYFWKTGKSVQVEQVPILTQKHEVLGQEILTSDKVGVRINFVAYTHVISAKDYSLKVENAKDQFYVGIQLALRKHISNITIDELLANRAKLEEDVLADIKTVGKRLFLEVESVGVKDIILPGDYRDIMNTVLIAEKQAQANVITRREEVASTRSLLNTAKLLENNEILRRLKEYEYIEKISENVSQFNVNANGNVLEDLLKLVDKK